MIVFQHGRTDWVDPRYPVSGPTFNWATIEWVVLHYTAAINLIDGDPGEHADNLPAYLRAIHRDYLNRKPTGYSIGYNAAVDWLGGTWELRGDTFKAAANANPDKPGDENAKTFAILMLVDGQDAATPLAAAAVRGLVAQIRAVKPDVIVVGHRDVDATQCPGTGVYAQIQADVFEPFDDPPPLPNPDPLPPSTDLPTLEDSSMIVTRKPNGSYWFTTDGVSCRWSDNDLMDRVLRAYRCTDLVSGTVVTTRKSITTLPGNDADAEAKRQFYMGSVVGPTARPAGVSL